MAHEQTLMLVNSMVNQLVHLAESVEQAVEGDGKIDALESIQLATQGLALASTMIPIFMKQTRDIRKDLVFVLQNGRFVLPE